MSKTFPSMLFLLLVCAGTTWGQADAELSLKPIEQRIADREFPSVFMAWATASLEDVDRPENMARHDLAFHAPGAAGLRWNRQPDGLADGVEPRSVPGALAFRKRLAELNPNLIFLAEIRYRDASRRFLPEDHAWWKRDDQGRRLAGWEEGGFFLLDLANPEFQENVAKKATAFTPTGRIGFTAPDCRMLRGTA
jgi:hypothetical protein